MKSDKLIITDFSIKKQVFNGITPKNNDTLVRALIRKIKSKNWSQIEINNIVYYKMYVMGKKYRAVITIVKNYVHLLVLYRHKNDGKSTKNISKYDNESAEVIKSNTIKVSNDYKNGNFIIFDIS